MIKLLFVFLSAIGNNLCKMFEEENIITELATEEVGVVNIIDGYSVFYEEECYFILNGEQRIKCASMPIIKRIGEVVYIGYYDEDKYMIFLYNIYGELLEKRVITDVEGKCEFVVFNNSLYLIGSSIKVLDDEMKSMSNIFIYNIEKNEYKYYGGLLNEKFIYSYIQDDKLYICFYKDALTYGDFGNAGTLENNITVAIIDNEFNILKYTVLNIKEEIVNFKVFNNIIIETNNSIITLTTELEVINSYSKNDDIINVFIGNYKTYIFCIDKVIVLNNDNLFIYDLLSIDMNEKVLVEYDGILYLKSDALYYVDIIDSNKWKCFENYYKDEDMDTLYTMYGKAKFIEKKCNTFFNENVYGDYNFEVLYETSRGLKFILILQQNIREEFNVCEGMTYPLGYRLLFNGSAYLDGKAIVNNYPLNVGGDHKLVVHGNGKEKEINFRVSDCSLIFNDIIYYNYDITVNVNEKVIIEYRLENINDEIKIKDVICNHDLLSFTLEEGILKLEFKKFDTVGLKQIYIEKIIYENQGIDNEIIINKMFDVLVIYKNIAMNVNGLKNGEINFEALESVGIIRGIKLIFINENGDIYEYVSIGDNYGKKILVRGIKEGTYELSVNALKYNTNGYQTVELCKGVIDVQENNFEFGELVCYQDENREVLKVSISKKVLNNYSNIAINNNVVYENKKINYKILIGFGLICLTSTLIISRIIKKKHFIKTKQNM